MYQTISQKTMKEYLKVRTAWRSVFSSLVLLTNTTTCTPNHSNVHPLCYSLPPFLPRSVLQCSLCVDVRRTPSSWIQSSSFPKRQFFYPSWYQSQYWNLPPSCSWRVWAVLHGRHAISTNMERLQTQDTIIRHRFSTNPRYRMETETLGSRRLLSEFPINTCFEGLQPTDISRSWRRQECLHHLSNDSEANLRHETWQLPSR